MRRLFGGKKQPGPPVATLEETSGSMETRIQGLRQKISECDKDLAQLKEEIKRSRGTTNSIAKQRAIQVLKRRKMYSQQLDGLMGQQFNVDQLQFQSQGVQDTINAVSAMKAAHKVQTQQLKQIKIGEVENLMDDMSDLMFDTEEINEVMSRNYALDGIDETELERELEELDEELFQEDMSRNSLKAPSYLPQVSSQKVENEVTF